MQVFDASRKASSSRRAHPSDVLWHGSVPSLEERRRQYGVDKVYPNTDLEQSVATFLCVKPCQIQADKEVVISHDKTSLWKISAIELVMAIIELRRLLKPGDSIGLLKIQKKLPPCRAEGWTAAAHRQGWTGSAYHSIVTVRGDILQR